MMWHMIYVFILLPKSTRVQGTCSFYFCLMCYVVMPDDACIRRFLIQFLSYRSSTPNLKLLLPKVYFNSIGDACAWTPNKVFRGTWPRYLGVGS